jgi:hypothetical protein
MCFGFLVAIRGQPSDCWPESLPPPELVELLAGDALSVPAAGTFPDPEPPMFAIGGTGSAAGWLVRLPLRSQTVVLLFAGDG